MAHAFKFNNDVPTNLVKTRLENAADPVYSNPEGWWFFDETWAGCYGPYADEKTARDALTAYARTL
jgi:hypothetical protein